MFCIGFLVTMPLYSCNNANNDAKYVIEGESYEMHIDKENFAFSFWDGNTKVVPEHAKSGVFLSGKLTVSSEQIGLIGNKPSKHIFLITNEQGEQARVFISLEENIVAITIEPLEQKESQISLALGGMLSAHGLGDVAASHESFNILANKQATYTIENDGGRKRWVSTFAIFPQDGIAGVFFDKGKKSVTIDKEQYVMDIVKKGKATFYYFLGNPRTIYANYKKVREKEGHKNVKPKSRLFELGWESWDALGWNTNQFTVKKILQKFHNNGYPIRWAVTGSGFWDKGGTTTSFGQWGKKFPDIASFRKWMHSKDIYWMIGLRTNFIPEGGPYFPKTNERDKNLRVDSFYGNKLTTEAKENGYLVTKGNGEVLQITSDIFPIVPSTLLNGDAPGAATWFQQQFAKWEVDGIKEDTMMNLDSLTNIYNRPIAEIADSGGLVMARNGEFVAPGTLLRINDTRVGQLAGRIPINYLQYAASGFPNVYSDVAGVHNMHNLKEIDKNIRHTWLLSLTTGLAVGAYPEKWPKEKQKLFKKAIDFHYKIAPYMYSEALKGYESGYPTTLTPLSIAFPKDTTTVDIPNFQWMIGASLLATPLLENLQTEKMDVYLPEGIWFDYENGKRYEGPVTLKNFEIPLEKIPCFVGGKGILIERSYNRSEFKAKVYFTGLDNNRFVFTYPNSIDKNEIDASSVKFFEDLIVMDKTSDKSIPYKVDPVSGAISFDLIRNHNYVLLNP